MQSTFDARAVEVEVGIAHVLASDDGVDRVDRRRVFAEAAVDDVVFAVAGEDRVVVLAAFEGVFAGAAFEFVFAPAALQHVCAVGADEMVPFRAAGQVLDVGVDVLVAVWGRRCVRRRG